MAFQSKYTEEEKAAKIRNLLDTAKDVVKRENYNISLEIDKTKSASTYKSKITGVATQLSMVINYAYCATDTQTWEEIKNLADEVEKIIGKMLEKQEKLVKASKTEYAESAKKTLEKKLYASTVDRHLNCDSTSKSYGVLQRIAGDRAKNIREICMNAYSVKDEKTWETIRYEITENFKDIKTYLHREAEVRTEKVKPSRSMSGPTTPYRQSRFNFHDMEKSLGID